MNIINQSRGCNYREVHDPHKGPVRGQTKYAIEAKRSDRLVQHCLRIIEQYVQVFKVKWVLENPKGFLCQRQFMVNMRVEHRLVRVDNCAFRGHYMKPTHLWTNLEFIPKGTAGCVARRCSRACVVGKREAKGKWVHDNAIGQASSQAVSGEGQRRNRSQRCCTWS